MTLDIVAYNRPDVACTAARYTVVKVPAKAHFLVSAQAEADRDHYIVRGRPIPGTAFHGEYVVNLAGVPVTGRHIRDDTIDWREHLRRSCSRTQEGSLVGFVGAGNLTMNPQFIGFSQGQVYCVRLQSFDRAFPFVLSDQEGVRFEQVRCSPDDPPRGDGISGPQLVREGKPLNLDELARMASEGQFYDLRHAIQFPHITWESQGGSGMASPPPIDVGLERFWRDGMLDPQAVTSAILGEPVEIPLQPYVEVFPPAGQPIGLDRLTATLNAQGYVEANRPQARGEWNLAHDRIQVVFYLGIYNHSLLGMGEDSALVWLGLSSQGGRTGLTLLDTAQLAADYMTDAILVDNGGDVMCRLDDSWLVPSAYERERIRGLLLLKGDRGAARYESHPVGVCPITEQRLL